MAPFEVWLLLVLTAFGIIGTNSFYLNNTDEILTENKTYGLDELFSRVQENSPTGSSKVPSELPKNTMDAVTIIWYVSTFLALLTFFLLMACSERGCRRVNNGQSSQTTNALQPRQLTPAPSYTEFAPPSYETVISKDKSSSVYVVQISTSENEKDKESPPPSIFSMISDPQKTDK